MDVQSCLNILRDSGVDVDAAVDRLMGNGELYLKFVKRLPEQLNLAVIREALARRDAETFHFYLHTLKGFASNLGITEIAGKAQAGLIEFRAAQFRSAAKLERCLEEIEAAGEKVSAVLMEMEAAEHAHEEKGQGGTECAAPY